MPHLPCAGATGRPDTRQVIAEMIQCIEEGLPLPMHLRDASIKFAIKNVLATWSTSIVASPFQKLEQFAVRLREAGLVASEIAAHVFGAAADNVTINAKNLETTLLGIGVSFLSNADVDAVLRSLDFDGDGVVTRPEIMFFLDRLIVLGDDLGGTGGTHRLRNCALNLLEVTDDLELTMVAQAANSVRPGKVVGYDFALLFEQQRGKMLDVDELDSIELQGLTNDDVARLRPYVQVKSYADAELIIAADDPSDGNVYFLLNGRAEVETNDVSVYSVPPGSSFGEVALYFDANRGSGVRAHGTQTRCLTLHKSSLRKMPNDLAELVKK